MTRLAITIVLLTLAVVLVRRRQRKGTTGEPLRVSSRTAISRGVMAAVLEVEQRRFLVTITPTSTTLVAELGGPERAPAEPADDAAAPATTGDPTLLERLRVRTTRTYDPELLARMRAGH